MNDSTNATSETDVLLRHHLYSNINERRRHFGAIKSIADELQRPLPEIAQLYEDILEYLRGRAQVTDFLPILVSKKVRELCRRNVVKKTSPFGQGKENPRERRF